MCQRPPFQLDSLMLAAAGSLSGISLPGTTVSVTPTAADLAETEDVQLTPAIRAQAAALNNNPVQIHNWVRNNMDRRKGTLHFSGVLATCPGSPEPYRDECLNEHWFVSLAHAKAVIEAWRREYNEERPKNSLGGLTPSAYARQLANKSATLTPGP